MIEFKHVRLRYHYDDSVVLKDLNFTLNNGVNTILCDSQSGKSSVCKLLTKQFAPIDGQICVDGQDISGITNRDLGILYIPSEPAFFENRSVAYNITYPLKVRKAAKDERIKRFDEIASKFNLTYGDVKLKKLSKSERKRVALARGLTVKRKTVLFDDFFESADQIDEVISLFDDVETIVILTSDINLVRGNVVVLDDGVAVYQGDVNGAREIRKNLSWIVDILRSE